MHHIIPSILVKTPEEFEAMVRTLEPHTEWVHLDIIDGIFADNATIKGYEELKKIATKLKFEVHLMVQKPEDQLAEWYATSAERIIIHAESEGDHLKMLQEIEEHGKQRVLAFNPQTDTSKFESLMPHCHHVQFMTVNPGFYGSPLIPEAITKISDFHDRHKGVILAADGGVTPATAPQLAKAGVSILVCGSYIAQSDNVAHAIQTLKDVQSL
jgi:ribulose-phosphate 3-epimerase